MVEICFDYFNKSSVADDYNFVRRYDKAMKEVDAKLERLTYGFLGSITRKFGRKVREGFYYLIGKIDD